MKKVNCLLTLVLVLSIMVVPVQAKDINLMKAGMPNAKLNPSVFKLEAVDYKLGLRSVSVDGNKDVYDSDINLDDGLRLLNLDVTLVPASDKADKYLDLARFSLGDVADPTPTYELKLKEYGLYDFGVKRSERDYVYQNGADADHSTYDFTRTQDSMHLTITPEELPKFFISKNKLDREGMSVLTKDLYETHAEYTLNTPINETSEDTTVGTEFSYAGYDFYLTHTQDDYTGSTIQELKAPVDPDEDPIGEGNGDYQNAETRSLDREIDELAVHKVFNDSLDVTLNLKDTRGDGAFSATGYVYGKDYNGDPLKDEKTANGTTEVDSFVGSIDATYLVNQDAYLHGGYKKTDTENNIYYLAGSVWDDPSTRVMDTQNLYNKKDKYYITGEYYFNDGLKAELGYIYNEEEDKGPHGPGETEEDGYQVGFLYNPRLLNN